MGFQHRKRTVRPTLEDIFNSPDPHGLLKRGAHKKPVVAAGLAVCSHCRHLDLIEPLGRRIKGKV